MRYRGRPTNWWPIVLLILATLIAVAAIYFLFLAPPAGPGPTAPPGQQTPITTPTASPTQ